MGGKGSTQESVLSLGDQKDPPIRREELTQTKGGCDSPEELMAVPVGGSGDLWRGLLGEMSFKDRRIRKGGWPKQESLGQAKGLALFYR